MLSVSEVGFSYGPTPVLAHVNLSCRSGEIVGLVSRSGYGKTTLVNLLLGLLEPSEGKIRIGSRTPAEAVAERRIGVVPQGAGSLLPQLTVFANAALPRVIAAGRTSTSSLDFAGMRAVWAALRTARIEHAARLRPFECSNGMRVRAQIARCLSYSRAVDLLILDEAFSSLDETTAEELYGDLQKIVKATGMMMMVVSHQLSEVCLLCDRVVPLWKASGDGPSVTGEPIIIDLPRPRTSDSYAIPAFAKARSLVRASLIKGMS